MQPQQPKEKTQVDYQAGLDPSALQPGAGMPSVNPMEDAMAIRSLFGTIHNELNEVNKNLVDPSVNLQAKNVDKSVMDRDILNIVGRNKPQQQNGAIPQQPQQLPQQQQFIPQQAPPQPQVDPNQLELNFDDSVTAIKIFNKLDDLETKMIRIEMKIDKLIEPSKNKKK